MCGHILCPLNARKGNRRQGTSSGRDSLEGGGGGEGGERQEDQGAGGYREISTIEGGP